MVQTMTTGLFQITTGSHLLEEAAKAQEISFLTFKDIHNKTEFLKEIAKKLHFPSYFEANWDALYECLTDLTWLDTEGVVLFFEDCPSFYKKHFEDFQGMISVLKAVVEHWKSRSKIFSLYFKDFPDLGLGAPSTL